MLVDSHCHLQLLNLATEADLDKLIATLPEYGVKHLFCVAVNLQDHENLSRYAAKYPEVSISVGLHPNEKVEVEPDFDTLMTMASHPKVIGIGETGLDFYRTEAEEPWQLERFRTLIKVAKTLKKPLIIHTRAAKKETLQMLTEENASEAGGVFHCFTEDWPTAEAAIDLGFYISFSGIVTFKNAVDIQEVAKKVPLNRILVETDAPYLAPVPFRGQPNQPGYVKYVAEYLANLRGISFEEMSRITSENFSKLFNISV